MHCHLSGSVSFEYLEKTAQQNGCYSVYEKLVAVRQEYLELTKEQPEVGFSEASIGLIWKQFGLIHQIIQKLTDIEDAVVDVVNHSSANYLEIRTTPKPTKNTTVKDYIQAFESGLLRAKQEIDGTLAYGLLSLDRTLHTLEDAHYFIEYIKKSPHKVLVGLDICGNPIAKRSLTPEALSTLIPLALANQVAIAIHMGESDSDIERQDTDTILSALELWKSTQPQQDKNPLHGKARLGHCIYLTLTQKKRIKELGIPIEICPTCHSKLNWHLEKSPHPAIAIHTDESDPLVVGTDDETIFNASTAYEFTRFLGFFSNTKQLTEEALQKHQSGFHFST